MYLAPLDCDKAIELSTVGMSTAMSVLASTLERSREVHTAILRSSVLALSGDEIGTSKRSTVR